MTGTHQAPSAGERVRTARAAGLLGAGTLIARILGLVRDIVVAFFLGTGHTADAWLVAFRIPNVLRVALTEGAISSALVPVLNRHLETRPLGETRRFFASAVGSALVLFGLVSLAGVVAAPLLARGLSPGFEGVPHKLELTASLMRWTFVYLFLVGLASVYMGALQSLGRFVTTAVSPSLFNVGMLLAIVTVCRLTDPSRDAWVYCVLGGALVSGVVQLAIQLPPLAGSGLLSMPRFEFRHPAVRTMWGLMLPSLLGVSLAEVSLLITTVLGSLLAAGTVTVLELSGRIVQVPFSIIGGGLATALLPLLSKQAARNEMTEVRATVSIALRVTVYVMVPLALVFIFLAQDLVRFLLERGAFTADSTVRTAQALAFYTPFLLGGSVMRLASAAFFSFQDTRTPVKASIWSLVVNAVLGTVLMRPMGANGLALAAALGIVATACVLVWHLAKRVGGFPREGWGGLVLSVLVGSAALVASVVLARLALPSLTTGITLADRAIAVVVPAAVGLASYAAAGRVTRSGELRYLARTLQSS